jgi:hypothetical protein
MTPDDLLFAPILPWSAEEKLRELIGKVMTTPRSDNFTTVASREITELLKSHGFTTDEEIAEIVRRIIKDMGGNGDP